MATSSVAESLSSNLDKKKEPAVEVAGHSCYMVCKSMHPIPKTALCMTIQLCNILDRFFEIFLGKNDDPLGS